MTPSTGTTPSASRRGSLPLSYQSERKLCMVAKGIVRGLKDHFGEAIEIRETQCMHHDADCCRFDLVRAVPGMAPRAEVKARGMPAPALED